MQTTIKAIELKAGDSFIYGNEQVKIEKILEPREWLASDIVYFHYETNQYWGCVDGQIPGSTVVRLIHK